MRWSDVAIGLGHLMKSLGRDRQPRDGGADFEDMWVGGVATGTAASPMASPKGDQLRHAWGRHTSS